MEVSCPLYKTTIEESISDPPLCKKCVKEFGIPYSHDAPKLALSPVEYYRMGLDHLKNDEKLEAFFCFMLSSRRGNKDATCQLVMICSHGSAGEYRRCLSRCKKGSKISKMAYLGLNPHPMEEIERGPSLTNRAFVEQELEFIRKRSQLYAIKDEPKS